MAWQERSRQLQMLNDDHDYYRMELRQRMRELSRYRERMRRLGPSTFDQPGVGGGAGSLAEQDRIARYRT